MRLTLCLRCRTPPGSRALPHVAAPHHSGVLFVASLLARPPPLPSLQDVGGRWRRTAQLAHTPHPVQATMRCLTSSPTGHTNNSDTGATAATPASTPLSDEPLEVGYASAESLFLGIDDDDTADGSYHATPAAGDDSAFQPSQTSPQREPTSAAARAALKQRRRLYNSCQELDGVVQAEMRAEVARDMQDGAAAVPPLAPAGWRVLHATGSSFFTMSRVKKGGFLQKGAHGAPAEEADASPQQEVQPRYRSVHDMLTGRHTTAAQSRGQQQQQQPHIITPPSAAAAAGKHGNDARRVRLARSDTHITVFAPFRTLDLTLFDPHIDICEWARFDVLVRKTRPAATQTASARRSSFAKSPPPVTPLQGQQEVWDEGRCLFLRLACVNGELRLRTVQFVSPKLARALEEHAVFGQGEPLYLELLRRQRAEWAVQSDAVGSSSTNRWQTAASPLHVLDAPGASPASLSSSPLHAASADGRVLGMDALSSSGSGLATASELLTKQFDRAGEYARTFAYAGPYLTELSKELREALLEYVMSDLGISNEVAEYVCQLQYFLEQEEYVGWLAQWGQLASTMRKTL